MSIYSVLGVEQVYDAFDEYVHANALPPFSVDASCVEEAKRKGASAIQQYVDYTRRRFFSSGMFLPSVIQIMDEDGTLVFDASQSLVRSWPFESDERAVVPADGLPTRVCFISYNSRDSEFAKALYRGLLKRRFLCWFAPERPDMPKGVREEDELIKSRIADGVRSARVVLAVVSEHASASDWVEFEMASALEGARQASRPTIIGLEIAPVDSPRKWVHDLRLRHRTLAFAQWQDATWFEEEIRLLAEELDSIFGNRHR